MTHLPKRAFPRRSAYIITEYTVREGRFRDVIKNVGAGGLFVRTTRRIAVDQPIILQFPLFDFDKTFEVSGTVSRVTQQGFAVTYDEPIGDLICKKGHFPKIVHEGDRQG